VASRTLLLLLALLGGLGGLGGLGPLGREARAEEGSRLGTLIRWYLDETRPTKREDFLDAIERIADARRVAEAIRRGEHFVWSRQPKLKKGGPMPVFHPDRARIQPVADSAGDFAQLTLPEGYDPAHAYPLVIDVGPTRLQVPAGAVAVRVTPEAHPTARIAPWAAEGLVLSVVAHCFDLVHVDSDRVFLRGEGEYARLAWFIALHNPDRFAGLLAAQDVWPQAERLAANGAYLTVLAIERRKGDRRVARLMQALAPFNPAHVHLRAPLDPRQDATLLPAIESWWTSTRRRIVRGDLTIVSDRDFATRAFWARVAPRVSSLKQEALGRRGNYTHKAMNHVSTLKVTVDLKEPNTVHVEAKGVAAFNLYVDPEVFDTQLPLRVSINGGIPESKVIDPDIADLLEDYAERRDPGLLYVRRLSLSAPGTGIR